jgi:hypothetical protein
MPSVLLKYAVLTAVMIAVMTAVMTAVHYCCALLLLIALLLLLLPLLEAPLLPLLLLSTLSWWPYLPCCKHNYCAITKLAIYPPFGNFVQSLTA